MEITNENKECITIKSGYKDRKVYRDGDVWYLLKKHLNIHFGLSGPFALCKRFLQSDGHLMGDDKSHYLRTGCYDRKVGEVMMIYDPDWAVRSLYKAWNSCDEIRLFITKYSNQTKTTVIEDYEVFIYLIERTPKGDRCNVQVSKAGDVLLTKEFNVGKWSCKSLPLAAVNMVKQNEK